MKVARPPKAAVKATYPMLTKSTPAKTMWAVLYSDGTTRYIERPKGKRPR